MAVPKRRTSKTAKRKRRTHFKISVPGMVECSSCGEMKLSHRVCPSCGSYNGKEVVAK
ncbi:50S ribosomal protein L32 [Macrococcus equipercicus]|uniref:Large ribosomal subunit protein bL32 n=1 Tax=Macrococcus equipercicus TaxID=69967 RepID=A0A9Q9BN24_9STAP|nr:50S ribosomal protein L32 [Macrococcus equipercicus]KAA1042702.1 50S ribosomal protein L32 [Macrococcus equipercicus]UTH14568.1 50S ribosomal protein L32 [Macrococcus equipercicus]